MLHITRLLKILALLGAVAATLPLVACGQKGPLTLPSPSSGNSQPVKTPTAP